MFYLVCFDIVEDSIRQKVAKALKGFGMRVQKSVFECPELTEQQFLRLKEKVESLIDASQDSVRYYRQCAACLPRCEISGTGEPPEQKAFRVL